MCPARLLPFRAVLPAGELRRGREPSLHRGRPDNMIMFITIISLLSLLLLLVVVILVVVVVLVDDDFINYSCPFRRSTPSWQWTLLLQRPPFTSTNICTQHISTDYHKETISTEYRCTHIYIYIYMYIIIYMLYIYIYVCVYMICVYVYVYIYICIHRERERERERCVNSVVAVNPPFTELLKIPYIKLN